MTTTNMMVSVVCDDEAFVMVRLNSGLILEIITLGKSPAKITTAPKMIVTLVHKKAQRSCFLSVKKRLEAKPRIASMGSVPGTTPAPSKISVDDQYHCCGDP